MIRLVKHAVGAWESRGLIIPPPADSCRNGRGRTILDTCTVHGIYDPQWYHCIMMYAYSHMLQILQGQGRKMPFERY